jgi:glycosyltransferase involved in cell wall biosynthesis
MASARILIDARLPWGSGIGRYVQNILPPVARRMSSDTFTLAVFRADEARARAATALCQNVTVKAVPIAPFSLSEQLSLEPLARNHDLTWFTNYWVPLRWRGRFVATVHDLIHVDPQFPASAFKRALARLTFRKVQRHAAQVIFVSRFSATTFVRTFGAPANFSIVHHGIDHGGSAFERPTERARTRMALVVGAFKAHKNLAMLLRAWQKADLHDWELTLVAPSDPVLSSVDISAAAERTPRVRVLRGIDDAALADLYTECGFVLVPSRYEGFGLPLLEAMSAGAPVVASTAPALVEVASGALLPFVDPADGEGWVQAIRSMAHTCGPSNAWQQMISERNRAVARSFTWERAADATAGVLRAALQRP